MKKFLLNDDDELIRLFMSAVLGVCLGKALNVICFHILGLSLFTAVLICLPVVIAVAVIGNAYIDKLWCKYIYKKSEKANEF